MDFYNNLYSVTMLKEKDNYPESWLENNFKHERGENIMRYGELKSYLSETQMEADGKKFLDTMNTIPVLKPSEEQCKWIIHLFISQIKQDSLIFIY